MPPWPDTLGRMSDVLVYVLIVIGVMSIGAFIFSLVQVRRKLKRDAEERLLREAGSLPQATAEILLALSDSIGANWADSVDVRQQVSDEPKRHSDILAPQGQSRAIKSPHDPSPEQTHLGVDHEARSSSAS